MADKERPTIFGDEAKRGRYPFKGGVLVSDTTPVQPNSESEPPTNPTHPAYADDGVEVFEVE